MLVSRIKSITNQLIENYPKFERVDNIEYLGVNFNDKNDMRKYMNESFMVGNVTIVY